MNPSQTEFVDAIESAGLGLTEHQIKQAARFARLLYAENENQNLTRITGIEEYIELHLRDVVELLGSEDLGVRVLDIGSGSGVPGLLAAALDPHTTRLWYLTESEVNKANFLSACKTELELSRVAVLHDRAEDVVKDLSPDTVIARAVGAVEKIAGWIWNCSTWNKLILFKSRGWSAEWKAAQESRFGKKLTVTHTRDYSNPTRTRVLVSLSRKNK